ncbi:MAG TPA: 5-carboxymethyl-2-hydroxymuconate Delta-isomerase [Flavobacteriales bacterium]|nr:5-carboxymethyl-2-hydroxymuconate Delta-isomerase [Flavobacteriales bacterium]
MPHFVIDCSESILYTSVATGSTGLDMVKNILKTVHDTAEQTGLFKPGDIKVRICPFQYHYNNGVQTDFIHVFGNIMEGRTTEQKAELSKNIIAKLKHMFPDVPVISMNIREFEKATYCNRNMIE